MAPLESTVVKTITRYLASRGAWYVKTTGVGKVGCPDLLVCYRGYFIAFEVKRAVEGSYGATPKQQLELGRIAAAGGRALVVYHVDDVARVLDAIP